MKLTAFFMIIGCLQLSAAGISQTVTIEVENAPLVKVFKMVEEQTGYMFFYEKKLLESTRPVTVKARNTSVADFLSLLLKDQPLGFSIRNTTITINRKEGKTQIPTTEPVVTVSPLIRVTGLVTGKDGAPLVGATVIDLTRSTHDFTDAKGRFSLEAEIGDSLQISYVDHEVLKLKVSAAEIRVKLKPIDKSMDNVEVVINTGYQKLRPNEMAGSVEVITEKMLQERVGPNILDRLRGMTNGLQFQNKTGTSKASGNPRSVLNMSIRGWNTINGPTDPLIIVDNFPYTGDIDNINPNDVESIILLKDAAATSIWGAKGGNGVIVINLKKGKFNQKTSISLSTTISYTDKPKLGKLPLLTTPEFIDQLIAFYGHSSLIQGIGGQGLNPVIEVLRNRNYDLISAADSAKAIDYLKTIDSRSEWDKYIYKHPLAQTYSLNFMGGGSNIAWNVSGSYYNERTRTQGQSSRATFNFGNTFRISPKLDIELSGEYVNSKTKSGGPEFQSISLPFSSHEQFPYLQLKDSNGNATGYSTRADRLILDTLGGGKLLDFKYYPLENWKHDYTTNTTNSYNFRGAVRFRPVKGLSFRVEMNSFQQIGEVKHMSDENSFFTRDIINVFSKIDRTTMTVDRLVPLGDIVRFTNRKKSSLNLRSIGEFEKTFNGRHSVRLMGGFDLSRDVHTGDGSVLLGYSEDPLIQTVVDLKSTYGQLPMLSGQPLYYALGANTLFDRTKLEERVISTLFAASYEYDKKYLVSGSLRKDGANIIGRQANDRWKPLWNIAGRWAVHQESFFHSNWVNTLNLSSSIGISGNVDITKTADPVASIVQGIPFPYLAVNIPPNPELRWEKFFQINWRLDLSLLNSRINLTFDYYIKRNRDLYGAIGSDFTQSPATTVQGNIAAMNGSGFELYLNTRNIVGKFNWGTTFRWSKQQTTVKNYYAKLDQSALIKVGNGSTIQSFTLLFPNQSLYSINAVRTAGLDNQGHMQYLVDGKPTTNIMDVFNDVATNGKDASSLKYFGSSDPRFSSSVINYFSWKQFTLSFQLLMEFGFYVKKGSVDSKFYNGSYHKDWRNMWKKPGDELHSVVPAWNTEPGGDNLVFQMYDMLDVDVVRGDHIRLDNIQLGYNVPLKSTNSGLKSLNIAFNASSFGVIWKASKEVQDPRAPDFMRYMLPDKSWSLRLTAGF